jgi:hypothetical protein
MPIDGHDILTTSRIKTFKMCRYRHWLEYILGVRQAEGEALRIGDAVHLGTEVYTVQTRSGVMPKAALGVAWESIRDRYDARIRDGQGAPDRLALEAEKARRMVQGWAWRWSKANIEYAMTEREFLLPIENPETNRATPNFKFGGKIDNVIKLPDGRLAVMERKTCSESLESESTYWKRLRLDEQITNYLNAAQAGGYAVESIVYDVIRKPSINPKQVFNLDENDDKIVRNPDGTRATKKDGTYRMSCDSKQGQKFDTREETIEEYGKRLIKDMYARPEFYFCRKTVPRFPSELEDAKSEMWDVQQDMRKAEKEGKHYKNSSACMSPFLCPHLDACANKRDLSVDPLPPGMVRVEWLHPELEGTRDEYTNQPAGAD